MLKRDLCTLKERDWFLGVTTGSNTNWVALKTCEVRVAAVGAIW